MLTDLTFLEPGRQWPPPSEDERLERYKDYRWLFENEHGKVFDEWIRLVRQDDAGIARELFLNYPKRLSTLWADLLLGEAPQFEAGKEDSQEQRKIEQLVTETSFIVQAYQVALDASRFGDGLFKVDFVDNNVVIEPQRPDIWFPVFDPDNQKRITHHVLAWVVERTETGWLGESTHEIIRVQIHERGRVENRAYMLNGSHLGERIELSQVREGLTEEWRTGLDRFLVTHAPSLQTSDRVFGYSDYQDLFGIIQEMEIRLAQVSRVLDKHADPSMYGDPNTVEIDAATGEYTFKSGGRFFQVTEDQTRPEYVTWDGQLTAAFEQFNELMRQFYIISETSPAAFGQTDQGRIYAESGTALRRLMMIPLAKVNRVRLFFDPACREVLLTASELMGGIEIRDLKIDWHDGLPDDPKELAEIEKMRLEAGNTSLASSIKRLDGGTDKLIQEEVDAIREDMAGLAGVATGGVPPLQLRFDTEGEE